MTLNSSNSYEGQSGPDRNGKPTARDARPKPGLVANSRKSCPKRKESRPSLSIRCRRQHCKEKEPERTGHLLWWQLDFFRQFEKPTHGGPVLSNWSSGKDKLLSFFNNFNCSNATTRLNLNNIESGFNTLKVYYYGFRIETIKFFNSLSLYICN